MRKYSSLGSYGRPSNIILMVGVTLSIAFLFFCVIMMQPGPDLPPPTEIYPSSGDTRKVLRRTIERDRPARFRQQARRPAGQIEQERREHLQKYKEKYHGGGSDNGPERPVITIPSPIEAPPPTPNKIRVALISAFKGDRYAYMAKLSAETKKKYAKMHGYTYFQDDDLISDTATWHQRSAIRTKAFMQHIDDFDWMYWSDVDVFFTNPFVTMEDIIKEGRGAHVIVSRDWGDRQVNPGSMLVKCSTFVKKFIADWDAAIEEVTDDLRAFQKLMQDNPDYENRKVRYIKQSILNPYHDVEVTNDGKISPQPRPHPDGHELWTKDALMVHVVNCLRTARNDCHVLADHYFRIAEDTFKEAGYPLVPLLAPPPQPEEEQDN